MFFALRISYGTSMSDHSSAPQVQIPLDRIQAFFIADYNFIT